MTDKYEANFELIIRARPEGGEAWEEILRAPGMATGTQDCLAQCHKILDAVAMYGDNTPGALTLLSAELGTSEVVNVTKLGRGGDA